MTTLWYKNAILYGLDIDKFQDSNGDGWGDFPGALGRLDYLADLGVTCLWLLPFYPSPHRDNGYDVVDYCAVDPRYGTLKDFQTFLAGARERGIRILIDMVANHTSDQHPWFQEARRDKTSKYHDYYIWAQEPPEKSAHQPIFPGAENSVWHYDEVAGAYYFHIFYHFQPSLNHANPDVRAEFQRILKFWLDLGVDGFRIDAAPHMIEPKDSPETIVPHPHDILREMSAFVRGQSPDAALLAEADGEPDELPAFFGDGREMHLLFNFYLDNYLFLAFARRNANTLGRVLTQFPNIPREGQWANFLRNLDELDLERLTEDERQVVYAAFAPDEDMRIYNRGIRRRTAPMFGGNRRQMEMAYSLLFSLPGAPLVVYGDEIGMGDDLSQPERNSVRTPMQWADELNGGFSTAPVSKLVRPVIDTGEFGYERVNVTDQQRDPDSFLNWMKRLIEIRKQNPQLGTELCHVFDVGAPEVLAHQVQLDGHNLIALHNLSDKPLTVTLDVNDTLTEALANQAYPALNHSREFSLPGFGYRWFRTVARR